MKSVNRVRWSDNDRYFGPFTYAHDTRGYRPLAIVLGSGDDDDYPGCRIRISAFGHTLIAKLPPIIKPWREKVFPKSWSAETVARLGRDWYYDIHEREYGFSCADGHLNVYLGRQTNDSSTEQRWGTFLPWTQWRHVRHSRYDLSGNHYWTESKGIKSVYAGWAELQGVEARCPSASFEFADYDGQRLTASTVIEEREWRFGTGRFKWLSLFRRPKIQRSLDITFSGETGRRKGSWKGGTIGHSIEMLAGELHEAAFRRYCDEHEMVFVGAVTEPSA